VPPRDALALRAAAFLSGAAALVFETLWFRQAGLLLGNAVWSSSIVLASFMAGLAIGNLAAGRVGARLRRPLRVYAALELVVGAAGALLVIGLPVLVPVFLPALRASLASTAGLHAVRSVVAFLLLVIPASAMGATLPVLVKALSRSGGRFGWTLGQLYGWNTMGAVAGALASEGLLIPLLGVKGSALAALGLDALAAAIAWRLDRAVDGPAAEPAAPEQPRADTPWAALSAAALAGAILLALEVVWFRFLLLTVIGTSRAFAVMLAVVLLGIALGGLAASRWSRSGAPSGAAPVLVAFLAGAATLCTYAYSTSQILGLAVPLMLPTCLLSGLLFTMVGDAVRQRTSDDARATGLVTLANTMGAMLGALVGGFLLLPRLGVERSIYGLALAYLGVALALLPRSFASPRPWRVALAAAAGVYALALATFPFGLMARQYLVTAIVRWFALQPPDRDVVAVREGLTETAMVTRAARWGTPYSYLLLTNSISMAPWNQRSSRYMREFVYLPVALHPEARRALLISYGVGVTAKALTDTTSLQSIDVVDVSRDVVKATRVVYPGPGEHPLDDPRVKLHIEDGRFFLASRSETFDIITGEPPPPVAAGISALYSKEYFHLLRARLAEGGVASYWLPVHEMRVRDSQAIAAAFCAAFPDCSLWQGWGAQWILLGTRNARPVSEADFTRQWREPRLRWQLEAMAFDRPEDLGATFLGDAADLAEWTRGVPPVDDDHPHRITPEVLDLYEPYAVYADPAAARARFAASAFVRRYWPGGLRERTLTAFEEQRPALREGWTARGRVLPPLPELHFVLTRSSHRTPVLWLFGADALIAQAARSARARGVTGPELDEALGVAEMADRNYAAAEALFARAQPYSVWPGKLAQWRALALAITGNKRGAAALVPRLRDCPRPEEQEGWRWLSASFGLPLPS
jgi:spermidine synthase